jgi:hypothetical protein
LTSDIIFDKLPLSKQFHFKSPTMNPFPSSALDGNLEQIASLVDSGKLESGL